MAGVGTTWAGTHVFQAESLITPITIDEVRSVVSRGLPVRALGTRHSFNDLADTPGSLLTVASIPADPVLDVDECTVTVGAGTRYGQLAAWLHEKGWALQNMGSLPHISVGGAIATATHGSGNGNRSLSAAVRALEYVDAAAEVVTVRRGHPDFAGLVVGLGAYGIVVRVALDVQPTFRVRQDVFEHMPWDAFLDDVAAVTGAAYSVSVFTDWQSHVLGQVWRKTRLADGDDATPVVPDRWLTARRRPTSRAIVPGSIEDNTTPQGGMPGPWSERLPHFRFDAVPSAGDEIQTEYFVPLDRGAEALEALRGLRDSITPQLIITELRTVAADDLWLSGAYDRDTLCIHFTWRNDRAGVLSVLPAIEERLRPFHARPHWGKLHGMTAPDIARVFPRLSDARALFHRLDPGRIFAGPSLLRLGVLSA